MTSVKVALIGLGPHCKRIYVRALKRYGIQPALIVDLESQKEAIEDFMVKQGMHSQVLFVPDSERDNAELSLKTQARFLEKIRLLGITCAIISTEPKAHFAYLKFLIKNEVPTLADKPITAPVDVANVEEQALQISSEYQELLRLSQSYGTAVMVQCQRRYDRRYRWILKQIRQVMAEYELPITHASITHCDGSWNMPDEFFYRENHPYKYGYGKLFHSGYHFIDLLALLLSYEQLPAAKQPTHCRISSSSYSPHDQLYSLDESFYQKALRSEAFSRQFQRWREGEYRRMGELDFVALLEFARGDKVLSTCSLNLLQSGFSRRAWTRLPEDTYKGNGRVRHETLSLQLGPLMNIQVHSYQAHEVAQRKNRSLDHGAVGGLEHFDIQVFRNTDLIGGAPCELIRGKDLYPQQEHRQDTFIGFNEQARDDCIADFLFGSRDGSTLLEQQLTIDLVTHAYASMARGRNGASPSSKFLLSPTYLNQTKDEDDQAELYCRVSG